MAIAEVKITKEEILGKCSAELIASRDCQAIAAKVSEGRMRNNDVEIGNGTIISVLQDLAVANALLDYLHSDTRFKYVVPLLDQGRLIASSPLVKATLNGFVGSILTQAQADALISVGTELAPVTMEEVAEVLYNADGSMK